MPIHPSWNRLDSTWYCVVTQVVLYCRVKRRTVVYLSPCWSNQVTTRVLHIPATSEPPRCSRCKQPALGVYGWESKSFGRVSTHKSILCATCGLNIADEIKAFEVPGDDKLAFYKPNSNVMIVVRFNYEKGLQPDRQAVADRIAPRKPPPPPAHATLDTIEGTHIHTYKRFPRVWCESCEAAVEPDVLTVINTTKSGKQYKRTTSTCRQCNKPVHNPIEG